MLIGFERDTGEPVSIPIIHSVFAGITRCGKSETVKTAVQRSEDTRFLILDVKKPRDYPQIGKDVPIYLEEKTEPLMLKRLLESQSHLSLKFEFPEILKVCKKASTYPEILQEVNRGLELKKHPIVKDKLLVLQHLLSRLVRELKQTPISDKLMLKGRVNVMNLSGVSKEMQQLAVHSTLKQLLDKGRNIVVILDEFHRFAPQYGSNPSKETVTDYIKEGGARNLWLWVIDQSITGVEKQVLKQCWVWVLGKQRELNEANRTLDQIPFETELDDKAIMRLKVGHFVVCTENWAKLTYIWPPIIPRSLAQKIAQGKVDVREAINLLQEKRGDEEMKYKQKLEEEKQRRLEVEKNLEKLKKRIPSRTEVKNLKKKLDEKEDKITELKRKIFNLESLESAIQEIAGKPEQVEIPKKLVKKEVKKAVREVLPKTIDLEHLEQVVNLSHKERVVKMDTSTQQGQILYCATQHFPNKKFTENQISEVLKEHGWNIPHNSLAPQLSSNLAKDGLLIKYSGRPNKYRLPGKLKIKVSEE